MAERKSGLASLPPGLLRPTTQPEPEAAASEPSEPAGPSEEADGQGRGDGAAESRTTRTRRKRAPVNAGPSKGRKIGLPDDIHDRLWQLAHQRRTTVSAVAAEILDRNLPRFRVEREG